MTKEWNWTWTVYTIRDDKGDVFYVGKTHHAPMTRFHAHKSSKTKLGEWIRNRIESKQEVHLVIEKQWFAMSLGDSDSSIGIKESASYEIELIKKYAELRGNVLFNFAYNSRRHEMIKVFKAEDYAPITE